VLSVNVGAARSTAHNDVGATGIDKRPAPGPVHVADPGPRGAGGSGLAGDAVCDRRAHGGTDQAVYAYAREDLDEWQRTLGRPLPCGVFGENLTTVGVDVTGARIGERWRIGSPGGVAPGPVLAVTGPRIPCRTFAGWLGERGWVRRFTDRGAPGAYLRVLQPGAASPGDVITVTRTDHEVTVGVVFRALTGEADLLPGLAAAGDDLPADIREVVSRRLAGRRLAGR
jgi:MOSC domain-containing protein YiiM